MANQELLMQAARTLGYVYDEEIGILFDDNNGDAVKIDWNPLEDMSDALKLAVDLQMSVDIRSSGVVVKDRYEDVVIKEWIGEVPYVYAAVCQAIVKCAAKTGEHL